MTRRAALPGAAELFRTTESRSPEPGEPVAASAQASPSTETLRSGSGRRKHDSKITVYVSDAELLALEQARLALRGQHGVAVDRGRIVREAVAVLLADLDEQAEDSVLVRRLRQESAE